LTVPTADLARIASKAAWLERWVDKPQLLAGPGHRALGLEALGAAGLVEREHKAFGEERNTALESLFCLLLVYLNRGLTGQGEPAARTTGRRRQLVTRFRALLERQEGAALSVSAHAARLAVTPAHLNRTVKAVTGRTAGALIHDRVLLAAKRNLVFTDQSIAEIAFALGFSSPSYFTRFFSAQTGETPRGFRRRMRHGAEPGAGRNRPDGRGSNPRHRTPGPRL